LVDANQFDDRNNLLGSGLKITTPSISQTIQIILKSRFKVIMKRMEFIIGILIPMGFLFGMIMLSV